MRPAARGKGESGGALRHRLLVVVLVAGAGAVDRAGAADGSAHAVTPSHRLQFAPRRIDQRDADQGQNAPNDRMTGGLLPDRSVLTQCGIQFGHFCRKFALDAVTSLFERFSDLLANLSRIAGRAPVHLFRLHGPHVGEVADRLEPAHSDHLEVLHDDYGDTKALNNFRQFVRRDRLRQVLDEWHVPVSLDPLEHVLLLEPGATPDEVGSDHP